MQITLTKLFSFDITIFHKINISRLYYKRFTSSLILVALGSSVLIINLLMVTLHFGRILSIWCFNDISFSNISLGVSVIALFVPTWIITFCNSSCNKSLRFFSLSQIFPPGMGWTRMRLVFDSLLSSVFFFFFLQFALTCLHNLQKKIKS